MIPFCIHCEQILLLFINATNSTATFSGYNSKKDQFHNVTITSPSPTNKLINFDPTTTNYDENESPRITCSVDNGVEIVGKFADLSNKFPNLDLQNKEKHPQLKLPDLIEYQRLLTIAAQNN